MGNAKRRKQFDPDFGAPPVYTLRVHRECAANETADHALLFEIPFTVEYFPDSRKQYRRAIAITYQIMGYLVDPEHPERIKALKTTLGNSAFCQLRSLLRELPSVFWATLKDQRDRFVVGNNGDYVSFSNSENCRQDPSFVRTFERHVATEDYLELAVS